MDKKRIHSMLEKMTEWTESEMQSKGKENIDTEEMGKVVDMVKDLAEAEMYVWKKCYYESIVKAMEESEKEDVLMLKMMIEEHGEAEGRMGYDRWRNSKGRFAPKGTGHETSMAMATGRAGYDTRTPGPYYDDPRMWTEPWASAMGYDGHSRNGSRPGSDGSGMGSSQSGSAASRMGYTPDDMRNVNQDTRSQYHDARRHYHETNSQDDKMKMDAKADEYLHESIETMRDIFVQSDPKMQQKMREDLSRLFREMGGK